MPFPIDDVAELAVALGIGLLIGIERERNKAKGSRQSVAGVRTFMLLGLAGALSDWIGELGIIVAGAFVSLLVFASYRRAPPSDPGLTTEIAMLVTFLLGIMAMRATPLAAALGVVATVVLASKSKLHSFVREALTEQELHDLLLLMAAAFVVLPLLPDEPIDPWGAINFRKLWFLVIAVMTVSSAGYVALRAFGSRLGLVLAGLAGGFVSSTATIAAMGDRARTMPKQCASFASAALASNVGTIIQLAVVLGTLSPTLLKQAAWPLAAAGAVALGAALVAGWRALSAPSGQAELLGRRPFEPKHVLGFVAILGTVMLLAAIARSQLGEASLAWVLAASGLADVHAAAASAAQLVASGNVQIQTGLVGVLAALASNSAMKCTVAVIKGGRTYALMVLPGVILMVAAFAVTMMLGPGSTTSS
jgi:uncharacterized membrane protein (DUF4010 family)